MPKTRNAALDLWFQSHQILLEDVKTFSNSKPELWEQEMQERGLEESTNPSYDNHRFEENRISFVKSVDPASDDNNTKEEKPERRASSAESSSQGVGEMLGQSPLQSFLVPNANTVANDMPSFLEGVHGSVAPKIDPQQRQQPQFLGPPMAASSGTSRDALGNPAPLPQTVPNYQVSDQWPAELPFFVPHQNHIHQAPPRSSPQHLDLAQTGYFPMQMHPMMYHPMMPGLSRGFNPPQLPGANNPRKRQFFSTTDTSGYESQKQRKRVKPWRRSSKASSKYRGVTHHKRDNRWLARAWIDNKMVHLGSYKKEKDAARAVRRKYLEVYGTVEDAVEVSDDSDNNA